MMHEKDGGQGKRRESEERQNCVCLSGEVGASGRIATGGPRRKGRKN